MSFIFEIIRELLAAWGTGSRKVKIAIILAGGLLAVGSLVFMFSDVVGYEYERQLGRTAALVLLGAGALIAVVVINLQRGKEEVKREQKIEAVERRVQENPKEPQNILELARLTLQDYLDRNLSQIRSIFWLTAFVMVCGFSLIAAGAYEAFRDSRNFNASVLTAVSGVVVSFIGGTFLILYKSTMAQAKDYVTMLERINAVGMSMQILKDLDDGDKELKHQTIAEVAARLLHMYSTDIPQVGATRRKPRSAGPHVALARPD